MYVHSSQKRYPLNCVMYLNVNQFLCVSQWTNILIANFTLVRQSLNIMGEVYNSEMTILSVC